jgi:hypothetical protein
LNLTEDWEFGVLGVYNYHKPGKLDEYFKHIIETDKYLEGDVCEVGVFRGSSILATALLLKQVGSNKKIYGFDSFSGFPGYHKNDQLEMFEKMFSQGQISKELFNKVKKNQEYRSLALGHVTVENISSSGDFSNNVLSLLQRKINLLNLDNIILVEGDFKNTMRSGSFPAVKFSSCLIDCDLYEGYQASLPFVWEKLVRGGYLYLDEYYSLKFPGARIATDEFFNDKLDKPLMHNLIDGDFERWHVRKLY